MGRRRDISNYPSIDQKTIEKMSRYAIDRRVIADLDAFCKQKTEMTTMLGEWKVEKRKLFDTDGFIWIGNLRDGLAIYNEDGHQIGEYEIVNKTIPAWNSKDGKEEVIEQGRFKWFTFDPYRFHNIAISTQHYVYCGRLVHESITSEEEVKKLANEANKLIPDVSIWYKGRLGEEGRYYESFQDWYIRHRGYAGQQNDLMFAEGNSHNSIMGDIKYAAERRW